MTSIIFIVLKYVFKFFGMELRYDDDTLVEGDEAICSERLYVRTERQEEQELVEIADGRLGPPQPPPGESPVRIDVGDGP
jgi:hypothetical protein